MLFIWTDSLVLFHESPRFLFTLGGGECCSAHPG